MPRVERSEVNHGWLIVHVEPNELVTPAGKVLPYGCCIGIIRTTRAFEVYYPAASHPRDYGAAARAVLEAIAAELPPVDLFKASQSECLTIWNDFDKASRAAKRRALEGLDLDGQSPFQVCSTIACLASNRGAYLSCSAKGSQQGMDCYHMAYEGALKRLPPAVRAAFWPECLECTDLAERVRNLRSKRP